MKTGAWLAAISATVSAGVGDWYCSRMTKRLRCDKSTHIRILSEFFLDVTTIGAHHIMAWVTGVMIFCDWRRSSSAFSLLRYANGIFCGMCTQNDWAFAPLYTPNLAIKDSGVHIDHLALCRYACIGADDTDINCFG